MELADIANEALKSGLYLAAINQFLLPFAHSFTSTFFMNQNLKVKKEKVSEYINLPGDFKAIDYINLANSIVHNHKTKEGGCKQYTHTTFKIYMQLITQNNRKYLKNEIRVANGTGIGPFNGGHAFLQVKQQEEFLNYECTRETPLLDVNEIRGYSRKNSQMKQQLTTGSDTLITGRSIPGTKLTIPSKKAWLMKGGLIGLVYNSFK